MKRNWELDELIEHWTLLPDEIKLLGNKTGATRLGFAIVLKYFQLFVHFPVQKPDVPNIVITHIASQVNVSPQDYQKYDWQSRMAMYHRSQIREFLSFRKAKVSDARAVVEWLIEKVLVTEASLEHLHEIVKGQFLSLKIEPPTEGRIERLIRSALRTFETNFFESIRQKLSAQTCINIDKLLDTSATEEEEQSTVKISLFRYLNSDPGKASLDSLFSEISKLEQLRQIGLPENMFAHISPKVLQTYKMRAATEPPRELRWHPEPIRYTLISAFCWLRTQEVTDNLVDLLMSIVHRIGTKAERRVDAQLMKDFKQVGGKHNLLYRIKRRFIHKEQLRNAIGKVVNAIFRVRSPQIWGEGTTTCASDSKKFGATNQNLMTEWHIRYGGRGVMIYWHVEKKSTCIYSQLKTCSSSEVAAMIEGVLRHDTEMTVQKNFVDSHGQSEVAFAFCHLLGFQLMPRLKGIHRQKLYRPEGISKDVYPHIKLVLTRSINWDLIRQQYEQMIKYATALRLGTAEPEAILRRFTRESVKHPTYQALAELGKVLKTIFLCQYLHSEALRCEINEGLNVVENWNSANGFIFYGKSGEFSSNQRSEQELVMLSLHLLQVCLVYINTLMLQQVLKTQIWRERLTSEDQRALSPLIYGHVNPYGTFRLDMSQRLQIEQEVA